MRKNYPGTRLLTASMLLLVLPVLVAAAGNTKGQKIADGISADDVEQNLKSHQTVYLRQMIENPEKRAEYVRSIYANKKLEQSIVDKGLDKSQPLLASLRNARSRALLDALIGYQFGLISEDLEALAEERYEAKPEIYKVRKKIKIALIYVEKHEGMEDQAKAEIEDIAAQLNAQPESDQLFYELAQKHSDDKMADQGGVNKKWLISPVNLETSQPILQASYALEVPGQMTDIVESKRGYSIVRLLKVTPETKLSFAEAKDGIMEQIMSELQYREKATVMTSLEAPEDMSIDDEAALKVITEEFEIRKAQAERN